MSKKRTYTFPVTLRLSPGMMEVVDGRARQRGVTAVDWIRHAIAFTFEEETYLREHLRAIGECPTKRSLRTVASNWTTQTHP